ncbi:hypothetical protein [Mycobacterium basiliense]|nr:hypothetical protein [Mycobacterium basiliense]
MPPVSHGQQILVDGGLVNSSPADARRADPDDEVIWVNQRRKYLLSKGFGFLPSFCRHPGLVRLLMAGADEVLPPLQDIVSRRGPYDLRPEPGRGAASCGH